MYFLCTLYNGIYNCHSIHFNFADVIEEVRAQRFSPVNMWYIFSDLNAPVTAKYVDGKIMVD